MIQKKRKTRENPLAFQRNISPFGWFVASYLIRFVELRDKKRNDPESRFLSWENTVIVKADDLGHAYEKVVAIAKEACVPYKGGAEGVPVKWEFVGVTELLPIYEKFADGAEIMWGSHHPKKLRLLKARVRKKCEFL